jgi:8-oxo-dGTP pyrophosphatase MutT (NUDIX family)
VNEARLPAAVVRPLLRLFGRLPPRLRRYLVRWWAPSYTVGAICVVHDDRERVLLVRHVYRRHWGAPGGLLDRGEHPAAAAVREVREEVGLDVVLGGEPRPVVWPAFQRIDFVYRCSVAPGVDPASARATSSEIVDVRWFPLADLPTLQRDTIEALKVLRS